MANHIKYWCLAILLIAVGCKKDKVEPITPEVPSKWDQIEGTYKVYDTLGYYLYDMNILHVPGDGINTDSLKFESIDGEFTFTEQQTTASNIPETFVKIGYHDTLYDSSGNRWKFLTPYDDPVYNNVLTNDTIRMHFRKTNINYYLLDLVPFVDCDCKQVAVKQN